MNFNSIQTVYDRTAMLYDVIFTPFYQPGRSQVIKSIQRNGGGRILDVGVGTGFHLRHYPRECEVVGIDLSPKMLDIARRRAAKHNLRNVSLHLMNAEKMEFADQSFEVVVALHVVTVTQDPAALMREIKRVCKPGGDIFIVNHFSHRNKMVRKLENAMDSMQNVIGWRMRFDYHEFIAGNDIAVRKAKPVNFMGYWTFIHAVNQANGVKHAPRQEAVLRVGK